MPEEPSKIIRDADFTVCYDTAHMRSLFGGSKNESSRRLKSGIPDFGTLKHVLAQISAVRTSWEVFVYYF